MKVCLLNDSFPPVIDGVANAVMNYASVLEAKEKGSVIVGTPEYPDADYSCYPYRVIPYKSHDTTKIVSGYRAGDPFSVSAVGDLTKFAPDIIHTHCPVASTVMARVLRKETGAPVVFTYHTKFGIDIATATRSKFLQKESIRALVSNISACDEVWAVSKGAGEDLRSLGYEGDYRVMCNGVDFEKGRVDDSAVAEVVKDFDLPAGVPVFLFVGRIMKYKGLPLILEAVSELSRQGTDHRTVFVGSGKDADELKAFVKENGITLYERTDDGIVRTQGTLDKGAVIFTGPIYDRNELRAWNTRADLFLFPSTYDTNGIVVREAAACGLGSVLIEGSCAAEGITDGRNGCIIKESAQDMFRLLRDISSDLPKAAEIGENAMNEIYISWEESVSAAYKRYEEILRMKSSGGLDVRKRAMSDRLLDLTADMLDSFSSVSDAGSGLYESFRENMYGMKENFAEAGRYISEKAENVKNVLRGYSENVREELEKAWKRQNSKKRP